MKIPVCSFDPSLRNWGIAEAILDLDTGILSTPTLTLIETVDLDGKQVRVNSNDLHLAQQIADIAIPTALRAKILFAEVPVGSQSARAMCSYGVCIGVLGSIRALGIPVIEVTAKEVKKVFTGNPEATKAEMIAQAVLEYPDANFPRSKGRVVAKAEHVADAIAAIHAGVKTPAFLNIMRILQSVKS
jgi:Holliday junction resolvasome RuvABC endonuclease subunit